MTYLTKGSVLRTPLRQDQGTLGVFGLSVNIDYAMSTDTNDVQSFPGLFYFLANCSYFTESASDTTGKFTTLLKTPHLLGLLIIDARCIRPLQFPGTRPIMREM